MKKLLIVNGSPSGSIGNCAALIKRVQKISKTAFDSEVVHLSEIKSFSSLVPKFKKADAFVFTSGTYWDSWGSPLQWCLEQMTALEGTSVLMGKPVAIFILMHSVGGKSVLSRLQGVLSTFGLLIPPMSGMVYSLVNDLALKSKTSHAKDLWQLADAELILENLKIAGDNPVPWKVWPVDAKDPRRIWLK